MDIGLQIFLVLTLIGTIYALGIRKKINVQVNRVALLASIVGMVFLVFHSIQTGLTKYALYLGLYFFIMGALSTVKLFRNK